MDIINKIDSIIKNSEKFIGMGEVATYIPELANVESDAFSIAITDTKGKSIVKGDSDIRFSMQSISKVITLIIALEDVGEDILFSKVGCEATEYKFNSLRPIEPIASNPLINAGAMTTSSLIKGKSIDEKFERILNKIKLLSNSKDIVFLDKIYKSEMQTTDINRSISYYLKSKGIFNQDANEVLDLYIRSCSIGVTVSELANISAVLANCGMSMDNKTRLIPKNIVKTTLSLMATCGMYEESGRHLIDVGIPSKSGVSGAIISIVPKKYGICVFSPRLDNCGNSIRGKEVLKELSEKLDLNIFV